MILFLSLKQPLGLLVAQVSGPATDSDPGCMILPLLFQRVQIQPSSGLSVLLVSKASESGPIAGAGCDRALQAVEL